MTQLNSTSRIALVTGASRGIGAAIALRLAADGYAVAVNYVSRAGEAEQVVQQIRAAGGQALACQGDVSDAAATTALFDLIEAQLGPISLLVNNAGIMPATLPQLANTDDASFERLLSVNLKGSFHTMREAAKRMPAGGRIINFSSSVVGLALPGYAVYAASKAAIETMTLILAKELRGRQITVNAVAPGPTATALFLDGKSEQQINQLASLAPLERLGQPDDIAGLVAMLASSEAGWVNGQTIRANGGIV